MNKDDRSLPWSIGAGYWI